MTLLQHHVLFGSICVPLPSGIIDIDRETVGSYLDHVRALATRGDYGKVCAILKCLFRFFQFEGFIQAPIIQSELKACLSSTLLLAVAQRYTWGLGRVQQPSKVPASGGIS